MNDLTARELDRLDDSVDVDHDVDHDVLVEAYARLSSEVRRHRAMVKRLEEWAIQLGDPLPHSVGNFIAAELRNRMWSP